MFARLHKTLQHTEDLILVSLLLFMILTAVGQIIMRNVFGSGVIWADAMVRIMVLWLGLLGAMAATRDDNHINIDILSRFMAPRLQTLARVITLLFTSALCGLTAYYGSRFVLMEYEFKSPGFAAVPAWICEIIIPIAFAIIALRCLLLAYSAFHTFFWPDKINAAPCSLSQP